MSTTTRSWSARMLVRAALHTDRGFFNVIWRWEFVYTVIKFKAIIIINLLLPVKLMGIVAHI